MFLAKLQIATKALDFIDEMQHIIAIESGILQHQAEKVWYRSQWLICDHHVALFHHALFDFGRNFVDFLVEYIAVQRHILKAWRNIPLTCSNLFFD